MTSGERRHKGREVLSRVFGVDKSRGVEARSYVGSVSVTNYTYFVGAGVVPSLGPVDAAER